MSRNSSRGEIWNSIVIALDFIRLKVSFSRSFLLVFGVTIYA